MKKNVFAAIMLFILAAVLGAGHAFAFSVAFDQKISVNEKPVATFKVNIQDKNLRAESSFGGTSAVMLRNEEGTFSYIPEQKMATKIPASMQQRNIADDLPNFEEFLKSNKAQQVGSEKVDGRDTDVYAFKDPVNGSDSKVWLWKEKKFPLKIEIKAPQGTTVIDFTNIQLDVPADAASFKLPADVKIVDLGRTFPEKGEGAAPAAKAPAKK